LRRRVKEDYESGRNKKIFSQPLDFYLRILIQ